MIDPDRFLIPLFFYSYCFIILVYIVDLKFVELKDAAEDIAEIAMMYTNAQHALCLFRCKNDRLTTMRPPVNNPDVFEEFQARKPYQYLQICYWKVLVNNCLINNF